MHLTGRYPDWWEGRRWDRPIAAWASGVSGESTRDNPQRVLFGRIGNIGTGSIPADAIVGEPKRAMGVNDLFDTVQIKHASGGNSTLAFKSYEKGREKWQGETLDLIWFDEEPPMDIYTEGLTRTNATGGMVYLTATPLLGMSEVVSQFYPEPNTDDRALIQMTIDDAEHYLPEERARIVAAYPAHEREARAKGIPMLGSGRIFPVEEKLITVAPFDIPKHWPVIAGVDFGWDHPAAASWLAHDRDADTIYVFDCYKQREATISTIASAIRAKGDKIPVAWPSDGNSVRDLRGGKTLAQLYRDEGLNMLMEHATFEDGGVSVEAGIADMLQRMTTGRWKVFSHLNDWFAEFRQYHRKDGIIVKEFDDVLSSSRYAHMMRRFASAERSAWSKPLSYDNRGIT